MADLKQFPKDIIRKIAVDHLDSQEDLENFKKVCSLWRSETSDVKYLCRSSQLPWLILADPPDNTSYRRIYSLSNLMCRKIDLPKSVEDADDNRRYFSSEGWLISVTMNQNLIYIFNIFSSQLIKLPQVPFHSMFSDFDWDEHSYYVDIRKFVVSTSTDIQIAMVFGQCREIAFWKLGRKEWVKGGDVNVVDDACFFRGQFYCIDSHSRVMAFDGSDGNCKQPRIIANLMSQGFNFDNAPIRFYIVVLDTTLLVIHRDVVLEDISGDDSVVYYTTLFQLIEVNVDDGKAREIKGIGDRALFVGYNSTFFVEACTSKRGFIPNCIYFTDDNIEYYFKANGGSDIGIFSLEQNKVIGQFYQGPSQFDKVTPPLWMQLPHP